LGALWFYLAVGLLCFEFVVSVYVWRHDVAVVVVFVRLNKVRCCQFQIRIMLFFDVLRNYLRVGTQSLNLHYT